MFERYARLVAWAAVVLIVLVTLSPISWRPDFGHANVERFLAFLLLGLLFGIAYPRHFILVSVFVLGAAILLEAAQLFIPGRDGTLPNLLIKLAGGTIGLGGALGTNAVIPRIRERR